MNQNDSKHVRACAQLHQPGADCTCPRTEGIWCAFPNPGKDAITIATHIASSDGMLSDEIETLIAVAPNTGPSRKNVRLMIAAPALLEALRGVLEPLRMGMRHVHYEGAHQQWQERLDAALSAISQATSEAEPDELEEEIENERELTRVDRAIAEERYRDELERR